MLRAPGLRRRGNVRHSRTYQSYLGDVRRGRACRSYRKSAADVLDRNGDLPAMRALSMFMAVEVSNSGAFRIDSSSVIGPLQIENQALKICRNFSFASR